MSQMADLTRLAQSSVASRPSSPTSPVTADACTPVGPPIVLSPDLSAAPVTPPAPTVVAVAQQVAATGGGAVEEIAAAAAMATQAAALPGADDVSTGPAISPTQVLTDSQRQASFEAIMQRRLLHPRSRSRTPNGSDGDMMTSSMMAMDPSTGEREAPLPNAVCAAPSFRLAAKSLTPKLKLRAQIESPLNSGEQMTLICVRRTGVRPQLSRCTVRGSSCHYDSLFSRGVRHLFYVVICHAPPAVIRYCTNLPHDVDSYLHALPCASDACADVLHVSPMVPAT